MSYDAQGNLANKNGVVHDFDFGNRLREVVGKEGYHYDGHGRRILTWRPDDSLDFSLYGQSGQLWYQEYDAKGLAIENVYLAGSLIATYEYNWNTDVFVTKYHHTDALGSPVAVTNAAGQVTDRTDWEPYGAAIGKPAYEGIGFTGHVHDAATKLTYMQQRYYDPAIGRFLSVDPVTANANSGVNFNRYWYANNNPYKFTDHDGCAPQDSWYGFNDQRFRDWVHAEKQLEGRGGARNYTQRELQNLYREWKDLGEPRGKGGRSNRGGGARGQRGFFTPGPFLRTNLILFITTYSPELGASEQSEIDERLRNAEAKYNAEHNEDPEPEKPATEQPKPSKEEPPPEKEEKIEQLKFQR